MQNALSATTDLVIILDPTREEGVSTKVQEISASVSLREQLQHRDQTIESQTQELVSLQQQLSQAKREASDAAARAV